jgi:hypothetical protein
MHILNTEFFNTKKIINNYITIYKKNNEVFTYNKENKNNFEKSNLNYKEIYLVTKEYVAHDNFIKSIVLFSDDHPSKINNKLLYYHMNKEKSLETYGFNILNDFETELINNILNTYQS